MLQVAALYVNTDGPYFNLLGVDPWDEARDARRYDGPYPVVAHPPCERWGKFWHGSTRTPHQYRLGADQGCFAAALQAVRTWGGVLEHPACSHAWRYFGLARPPLSGGWVEADAFGGWTCQVEQGFYGHASRKPTWLYAVRTNLPELAWGRGPQRLDPAEVERLGYIKARKSGVLAQIGGRHKKRLRSATPTEFRDLLIELARSVSHPAHRDMQIANNQSDHKNSEI